MGERSEQAEQMLALSKYITALEAVAEAARRMYVCHGCGDALIEEEFPAVCESCGAYCCETRENGGDCEIPGLVQALAALDALRAKEAKP